MKSEHVEVGGWRAWSVNDTTAFPDGGADGAVTSSATAFLWTWLLAAASDLVPHFRVGVRLEKQVRISPAVNENTLAYDVAVQLLPSDVLVDDVYARLGGKHVGVQVDQAELLLLDRVHVRDPHLSGGPVSRGESQLTGGHDGQWWTSRWLHFHFIKLKFKRLRNEPLDINMSFYTILYWLNKILEHPFVCMNVLK